MKYSFCHRCPICLLEMRSTRLSVTSFQSWSESFHGDRPQMKTYMSILWAEWGRTFTWFCAFLQLARGSVIELWSFLLSFQGAPWTGLAAGPKMLWSQVSNLIHQTHKGSIYPREAWRSGDSHALIYWKYIISKRGCGTFCERVHLHKNMCWIKLKFWMEQIGLI